MGFPRGVFNPPLADAQKQGRVSVVMKLRQREAEQQGAAHPGLVTSRKKVEGGWGCERPFR